MISIECRNGYYVPVSRIILLRHYKVGSSIRIEAILGHDYEVLVYDFEVKSEENGNRLGKELIEYIFALINGVQMGEFVARDGVIRQIDLELKLQRLRQK